MSKLQRQLCPKSEASPKRAGGLAGSVETILARNRHSPGAWLACERRRVYRTSTQEKDLPFVGPSRLAALSSCNSDKRGGLPLRDAALTVN